MPALVTCPACGVKVQMAEAILGKMVRCKSCEHRFTASLQVSRQLTPQATPAFHRPVRSPRNAGHLPLCPTCHSEVGWEANTCWHCMEELEPAQVLGDIPQPSDSPGPRQYQSALLATMANASAIVAAISFCLMGIGTLISLPLGIATYFWARMDLDRIGAGLPANENERASLSFAMNVSSASIVVSLLEIAIFGFSWLRWLRFGF